jgi:hypothetical protein
LNGLREVSRDVTQGSEKKVPETMSLELALIESILEEFREHVLVLGEGNHAVPDIPGRKNLKVFSQATGGASVVCNGDDSG